MSLYLAVNIYNHIPGDLLVTDGALPGGVIRQGQVVQDAGPAVDMAAPGQLLARQVLCVQVFCVQVF